MAKEKIKIRGLLKIAGRIFLCWGIIIAAKGIYDLFWGEPEANMFSPQKWDFVTRGQWMTWSGFELTYGLCCVGIWILLKKYSGFLPEIIERNYDQDKTV